MIDYGTADVKLFLVTFGKACEPHCASHGDSDCKDLGGISIRPFPLVVWLLGRKTPEKSI
jgi:hypothetical protein